LSLLGRLAAASLKIWDDPNKRQTLTHPDFSFNVYEQLFFFFLKLASGGSGRCHRPALEAHAMQKLRTYSEPPIEVSAAG